MKHLNVSIRSFGTYIPPNKVTSSELEDKYGIEKGWIQKTVGVESRFFIDQESAAEMGAEAALEAIKNAQIKFSDIDAIVCANGTSQQMIPCLASLIHKKLKLQDIPAFDIDSTCLSFITALNLLSSQIHLGMYNRVLIISSEIASPGLNWQDKESCFLFGDGAVAAVVERTPKSLSSKILNHVMKTYSEGADDCRIHYGGSLFPPWKYSKEIDAEFKFKMNGRQLFKLVSKHIQSLIDDIFSPLDMTIKDMKYIIPHQPSYSAIKLISKRLGVPLENFAITVKEYGNLIAASIPLSFHKSIEIGKIKRGDPILLIGTSAGISLGAMVIEY